MAAGGEGGFGLAEAAAILFGIMLVIYIAYKITKQREELRSTVKLLTNEHGGFVDDLQALVHA
jgi:hypothetical protein